MALQCGIVGLPNVGKSTLFNALTASAQAQAANFPFCTIEPNVGRVTVPDTRIGKLAEIAKSASILPTTLDFVDIAGLVRGASKGEGLGNQFLSHIREVDAIIHVVRCFEDENITHVDGSVDPLRDIETIETELMLADLQSIETRIQNLGKKAKSGDKNAKIELGLLEKFQKTLGDGVMARTVEIDEAEAPFAKTIHLLTQKPILYVCNVNENDLASGNDFVTRVQDHAGKFGTQAITICANIEEEIAQISDVEERKVFLEDMGLDQSGLDKIIKAAYDTLDLITYFTAGPKECRAWTIRRGTKAPQAAGVIHTDFERGFIRAETIAYDDYIAQSGESGARAAGKLRSEGKEYVVIDGDVLLFRFNT